MVTLLYSFVVFRGLGCILGQYDLILILTEIVTKIEWLKMFEMNEM
jgi:hypothetical protein